MVFTTGYLHQFWLPVQMLYPDNFFLSFFLQWFQMCSLHMVVVFGNRCDNKNNVELVDPNDHSKFEWRPVPTCQEGQEPSVKPWKPGSVHPKATDVSCIPCGHGWFSNHDTNFRCQKCTSCGNKDVRVNCSIYRDAVCSKSCKSKTHYFNETDGQCYTCTECCGKDMSNIEPHCLLRNLCVGSVIGQQGELHCKVLLSQKCDEPSENVSTNISSVINSNSGVLERNCSRPENNVTLPPTDSYPSTSKEGTTCRCSSASYRILGAFFTLKGGWRSGFYKNHLKIILVLDFIAWFKVLTFSHTFGNIGPGCSADCERAILERKTFEEELKCIPEGACQLVFITDHQYFNCPCTCRARHNRLCSNLLWFDNVPFTFCLQKCYSFFYAL